MRPLALIIFLFASVIVADAEETNYICVICSQGPLSGRIWISKWGAVCNDCYTLENRCSLCGLPIGKDFIKTGDGRFICKLDKPNAVLEAAAARDVFMEARRELGGLFGSGFTLNYPDVTVTLFNVDYWSEKGRGDGLHKFGFSSTRRTPKGACTHEVVMLSGRSRNELAATAAHEYTHLWINENRPPAHVIDDDVAEAICELSAYTLMEARAQPEQIKKILANPYTHGQITNLVEIEKACGAGYVLNWVKHGTGATLTTAPAALAAPLPAPTLTFANVSPAAPETLKLSGLMLDGQSRRAIISGLSFAAGDVKHLKLRDRTALVRCREINRTGVVLELDGQPEPVPLKIGEEKLLP